MVEQTEHFTTSKGEAMCTIARADVLVIKVTGHLDRPMGDFIVARVNRLFDGNKGRITSYFCDWSETTGYDSEVRTLFTQWVATHRNHVKFHLLVGSKIVSMGVSVANLALGGALTGYTNRPAFDAALRSARMGLTTMK